MKNVKLKLRDIGIPEDMLFYVHPADKGLSKEITKNGLREPYNSFYTYFFLDKEDIVLDIGANLGYFTLLCKNAKKIIAVEPIPQAIPILKKNVEKNGLKNKTKIINAAVGKENHLSLKIKDKFNHSKISKEDKDTIKVKGYDLKDLVQKYKTNFLRFDVEGYEYEILYENIPNKVNKIAMEFHPYFLGDEKIKELLNYLKEEGFQIKYYIEDPPKLLRSKVAEFPKIQKNWFFRKLFVIEKKDLSFEYVEKLIKGSRFENLTTFYSYIKNKMRTSYLFFQR